MDESVLRMFEPQDHMMQRLNTLADLIETKEKAMKVTSVGTNYSRKIPTAPYASVTLTAWVQIEVDEASGDTGEQALIEAMSLCRDAVKEAAAPFIKKTLPVTVEVEFNGKPVHGKDVNETDD